MGDRALVQFKDGEEVSPVIYLHWAGYRVGALLEQLKEHMTGREGDLGYSAARFVGICHNEIDGNLSLGMWNQKEPLQADDSHGDAGCFVVDVNDWSVETSGGYGLEET